MNKKIGTEQSHALMANLALTFPWDSVDSARSQEFVRSPHAGWLLAHIINKGIVAAAQCLTPADIFGAGWHAEPVDELKRAPLPESLDEKAVSFDSFCCDGENKITADQHIRRMRKSGVKCFGFEHFLFLWIQRDSLPEKWQETKTGRQRYIYFSADNLYGPEKGSAHDAGARVLVMTHGGDRWSYFPVMRYHDIEPQYQSAFA